MGDSQTLNVPPLNVPTPVGGATAAKQDTQTGHLATLAGAVSAGKMQVEGTFAAPTGGATEAKQDAGNTALSNILTKLADPATQTTLAAVLAKIIAAPATEAKQDTQITKLAGGLPAALGAGGGLKIDGSGTAVPVSGPLTDTQLRAAAVPVTDPDITPANCWAVAHAPAANAKATILKAATADKRHVCTALTVTLAAGSTAPAAVQVGVSLIQDAAGTPVTLWAAVLSLEAVAGDRTGVTKSCYIPTSAVNKSLTLEFSAAGGANTIEAVAMEGITLSV